MKQPSLIDAEKLYDWLYGNGYHEICEEIRLREGAGSFSPTPPVQPDTPKHGDRVLHGIYGMGTVVSGVYVPAPTVIVDLDNSARFHPLPITELEVIHDEQR